MVIDGLWDLESTESIFEKNQIIIIDNCYFILF